MRVDRVKFHRKVDEIVAAASHRPYFFQICIVLKNRKETRDLPFHRRLIYHIGPEMPACGIASIMLLIITDIGRTCAMDASVSFPVRKLRTCPFASGVSRSAPLRVGVSARTD